MPQKATRGAEEDRTFQPRAPGKYGIAFQAKTGEKEIFAKWLATPKEQRDPKTQGALAEMLQVDRTTLSAWKSDPEFAKQVLHLAAVKIIGRHADVVESLLRECMKGNVKAIEVYYKWAVLGRMEIQGEKEKVNAFKRALEVFQTGRVAEMISAIEDAQAVRGAEPIEAEVTDITEDDGKPNFTREVGDGEAGA